MTMTTLPSSGLSAEAKEFIPLISSSSTNIPLYVDENTVASIYPSDHQPLMVQTIYPMMITNSKGPDNLQFPEIEFHIQPSQQQQFHIDSCSNLSQTISITNGNSSTSNTSQIVLLPANNSATGFYPPPILYSPNEPPLQAYYPIEYCEPSLINFSLQQPNITSKSSRISAQQIRGNTFRHTHGTYRSSSRAINNRGNGTNINRNTYYDYSNRRNLSSNRGNTSMNKRISSSTSHSHDHNNSYYPSSSTSMRSRGYPSRSNPNHDDYHKDQFDYYHTDKDVYDNDYHHSTSHMNDDGTPFEFRPEDFPSLPNNPNQQSDKPPIQTTLSTNSKPISSWNTIVSSNPARPHSTSPCQEPRSDRSRSFNIKSTNKNERKSSIKTSIRASKIDDQIQPILPTKSTSDHPINDNFDDGFIQTKQQHRRLKRKNKIKDESISSIHNDDDDETHTNLNHTFNSLTISTEQTDTNQSINSTRLSSSSNNSSDTSDYDDAVDNFDGE